MLTFAPWLLVTGFAIAAAAAVMLWRAAVARQSEAELARANRELARRDGAPR